MWHEIMRRQKMKKNFKYFGVTWAVGLIIFNAITFSIPNEVFGVTRFDKGVFWVAYALITLSFVYQLITAYKFVKDDSMEKTFLNIPLLKTAYVAIVVSIAVGLIFMVFPVLPSWIGAIFCLLIAGYFVIACIKAETAAEIVHGIDTKIKENTEFIRTATVEAQTIYEVATLPEIISATKKVYEALRYSDPITIDSLSNVENQISENLKSLKTAVADSDTEKVVTLSDKLILLIKERNAKCKALK